MPRLPVSSPSLCASDALGELRNSRAEGSTAESVFCSVGTVIVSFVNDAGDFRRKSAVQFDWLYSDFAPRGPRLVHQRPSGELLSVYMLHTIC